MRRIIDNVFNPCLTWDFGTICLSLFVVIVVAIFSRPHLLFKSHHTSSKLAKNCLCIWASISLLFLFPHPQNLSEVDFLSRILHWWFKSSLSYKTVCFCLLRAARLTQVCFLPVAGVREGWSRQWSPLSMFWDFFLPRSLYHPPKLMQVKV